MKTRVAIAIPASVVSDTQHLREKTAKVGAISRAAAIFRVNQIIVYPDSPKANQKADASLIALLLSYMETPQYLRKRLFKLSPDLQYAGILPPLRTPHHPLNRETRKLKVGEFREGATVSQTKEGTLADIGVEKPALVRNEQLPADRRVTVKITRIDGRLEAELARPDDVEEYWGYNVVVEKRLFGELVKGGGFGLKIATSRLGIPLGSVADAVAGRWKSADTVLVAFGAPTRGLHEIAKHEGLRIDEAMDFVVNMIPNQGTETVRTEEAVFASLAVLNTLVFKA